VAQDLLPWRRPRHHAAFAIAARSSAQAALHWLRRTTRRASCATLEAAVASEAVSAAEVTLGHLDLAEVLPVTGVATTDSGTLRELELQSAEAAHRAGMPSRAVDYASVALGRVDPRTGACGRCRIRKRLGQYRRSTGDSTRPWTNSVGPSI
jgi:hypothetical protein